MRPTTRGTHAAPRRLRAPSIRHLHAPSIRDLRAMSAAPLRMLSPRGGGRHATGPRAGAVPRTPWAPVLALESSRRALVAAVVLGSTAAGLVSGQLVGTHANAVAAEAARRAVVVEQSMYVSDDERTMNEMSDAARRQQSGKIVAAQRQTVATAADRAQRVVLAASTLATSTATPSHPAEPQLPVDQPAEPQLPAELPADLVGLGDALTQVQVAIAAKDTTTALSVVDAMEQQVLAAAQAQASSAAEQVAASLAVVPDDEHAAVVTDMVAQVQLATASADVVGAAQAAVSATDAAAAVTRAADAETARLAAAVAASPNGVDDGRWGDHDNGRIPVDALARTDFGSHVLLRADAARALERLDAAFRARFGHDIDVSDAYRSLSAQVTTRDLRPTLAATPGTSNHGWGLAVDLVGGIDDATSAQHRWMDAHAGEYGWVNPTWASQASRFEPWHWEYVG